MINLRETHKYYCTDKNQPFIQLDDVILVHSGKTRRSMWRMGVVTELIKSKMDNIIRGTPKKLSNNFVEAPNQEIISDRVCTKY